MAGANSRHQPSRRDRGGSRRDRDRDDSIDLMPYDDEPRGRDKRPAPPSRRSTYNDGDGSAEYYDDEDRYYAPRSSDHKSRKQGRGGRRPHSEPRSRSTTRGGSHDDRRDRDHSVDNKKKRNQMIKAGLSAAAFEAFRQKNRPGDWVGEKGVRVATAAISAAVIDAGIDKNPNHGAMGNILKSTIGGLVFDKIANGGKGKR
ncbi:hypothetical protein INS49_004667 [Diaporthe citri]|uniref:uncharacterized protein n=1 Tax=Diaporthe citri TaxID=83186 RepID=UPI001C7EDDC8|nr:uncharacterized protein INS49_004667 [Diaporthe citri]KAG6354649.1 hypothetical protein INS49_004667 [Diaporthe citri]